MKSPSMHRQRGSVATIGFVVASMLVAALVVGAIVPVPPASAAGGDLDPSFGGDGKVTTDFTVGLDAARDVAIQTDGKIVVAGDGFSVSCCPSIGRFALARYRPNGTLDPTFGGDGKVTTILTTGLTTGGASAVAIQDDGKIVVGGTAGCAVDCSRC
jgi:uncharacterized delta-60 repeat protein